MSDKAIGFTVIEPANSSGVNTSSVACYFNNGQNSLSGAQNLTSLVENGSHWSGTIGSNNYQYGSTVYFWIEARDNANNLQWLNSSFQVIDIYPPTLTLVTTAPYTTLDNASVQKDLLVTVNAADNASGVQEVQLIFSINSYPGWNNVSMIYIANPLGNNLYQFTIPKDNLSAGTFNYIIKAIDNSNISQQISGNGNHSKCGIIDDSDTA